MSLGQPTGPREAGPTQTDEATLRDSAERLRLAVQASNVGLWDWNILTDEVRFSDEWKRQLGHAPHEIEDRFDEWRRRVHPEDLAATMDRVRAALADAASPHEAEFRMRHRDGSWRWIYARAEVHRDGAGRPVRMLGCHVDVTKRREAEEGMGRTAERLRLLLDSMDVIAFEFDADGRFLLSRGRGLERLGLAPDEVVGRTLAETFPELPGIGARLEQALQGEPQHFDVEVAGAVWDTRYLPVLDADGTVRRIFGIAVDVTDRTRVERQLRASEQRFAAAFHTSPDAIVLTGMDGHIVDVNEGFTRLTGIPRNEAIGHSTLELGVWTDPAEREAFGGRLMNEGRLVDQPIGFNHRTRGARIGIISADLAEVEDGRVVIAILRDVTEQRRSEGRIRDQLHELLRWQNVTLDRERRVRELKEEVNALLTRAGEPHRYDVGTESNGSAAPAR